MSASTSPNKECYALVTGGSSGLGRAFCLQLARDRWHVAVADVDRDGAAQTVSEIERCGGTGRIEQLDVTDAAAWQSVRDRLESNWPRLDLLVNNAGILATGDVGELDLARAERLLATNLLGTLYGCHAMVPWLKAHPHAQPDGSPGSVRPTIINVGSVFAFYSPPGLAAYNVSKAGVVSLSETLYGELRPHGVGVTVVCPGPMPTRLFERAAFSEEAYRELAARSVAATDLTPEAVADAALDAGKRRQLYVVLDRRAAANWRWKRLLPTTFLKTVGRRTQKDLESARAESSSDDANRANDRPQR